VSRSLATRKATTAQAKFLALCWSGERNPTVGAEATPTIRVCIANGWLQKTGKTGTYPNGSLYEAYEISDVGVDTIENYLFHARSKRVAP
jgi:hypothetical protein